MTTIAADHQTMASDSKVVLGDGQYNTQKIFRFDHCFVGVAGEGRAMADFLRWLHAGEKQDSIPASSDDNGCFTAIVLKRNGLFIYSNDYFLEPINQEFFAIGSGAYAAQAAMHLGYEPPKAIETAALVDPNTGGPIQVVTIDMLSKRGRK